MKQRELSFTLRLVGLGLLLVSCHGPQSSPGETVKAIFAHLERGQLEEATTLFSSRARQNLPEVKSLIADVPAAIQNAGGVTVEIGHEEIIGETATVTFDLRYGNGKREHVRYKMIKEDGQWRCDGNATVPASG